MTAVARKRLTHVKLEDPLPIDESAVIHMHPRWIIPLYPAFWQTVATHAQAAADFAKLQLARKRAAREADLRVE